MKSTPSNVKKVTQRPCVYTLYGKGGSLEYIGSSARCRTRLKQQLGAMKGITSFGIKYAKTKKQAQFSEKKQCNRKNPTRNKRCG